MVQEGKMLSMKKGAGGGESRGADRYCALPEGFQNRKC